MKYFLLKIARFVPSILPLVVFSSNGYVCTIVTLFTVVSLMFFLSYNYVCNYDFTGRTKEIIRARLINKFCTSANDEMIIWRIARRTSFDIS